MSTQGDGAGDRVAQWAREMRERTPVGDPPVVRVGRLRSGQWRLGAMARAAVSGRPTVLGALWFVALTLLRSLPMVAVLVVAPLDLWWCFVVWSFCLMCMGWQGYASVSGARRAGGVDGGSGE